MGPGRRALSWLRDGLPESDARQPVFAERKRCYDLIFACIQELDKVPVTDGVFPESKEFLAGYWIVDVESPERAYAIAAQASAAPGPGGKPLNLAIEVRQVMSGPPPELMP